MAIRYVLVRFSSNVSQFQTDMERAAASTKTLKQAGQEVAEADRVQAQAKQDLARAQNQYYGSTGQLSRKQAELSKAEAEGDQAAIGRAQRKLTSQVASTKAYEEAMVEQKAIAEEAATNVESAAQRQIAAQEQASESAQRSMKNMGKFMAIGGAVLLAGVYEATKAAMEFDNAMQGAASISDVTRNHLEEMSAQVLHLSETLPIGAEEFAKALTVAEKAGYQGYNAIALMQAAAEGVVAGTGDEQKAVEDLARTMNGFALGMADLNTVNNVLLAATRNGVGTYGDFANALSQIAPIAKANHVSIQDAAAAITVMSTRSQDASASGMALTRMIYALTREAQPAEKKLVDLYNAQHNLKVSSGEAVFAGIGLAGVFKLIGDATGGNAALVSEFFTNIRMAKGANAVFEDSGMAVVAMMKQFKDSTKLATDAAIQFEERQKTAANQVKIAHNEIKAAEITLGQAMLPTLGRVAKAVGELADWFAHLSPTVQKAIIFGGALLGTILLLGGAFLMLAPGIAAASTAMGVLVGAEAGATIGAIALDSALTPVILLAAPIIALGAVFMTMAMHAAQGRAAVERWVDALKQEQSGVTDSTQTMELNELAHQKVLQALDKYGVTLPQVLDTIRNGSRDTENFTQTVDALTQSTGFSTEALQAAGASTKEIDKAHRLLSEALNGNTDSYKKLVDFNYVYATSNKESMHVISTLSHENARASQAYNELKSVQEALIPVTAQNNAMLLQSGQFSANATEEMKKMSETETDVKNAITGMVSASKVFQAAMQQTKDDAKGFADATDVFKDGLKTYNDAVDQSAQSQYDAYKQVFDKRIQDLQDQSLAQSQSVSDQVSMYKALGDGSKISNFIVSQSGKDATRAVKDNSKDQIDALKASEKSLKDFQDTAKQNAGLFGGTHADMEKWLSDLQKTGKDTRDWNEDLKKIAANGGSQDLVNQLRAMGRDAIPLVHQFAQSTKDEIKVANDAIASLTPNAKTSFDEFATMLHKNLEDEANFEKNLMTLGARGMTDLMDYFAKAGPEAADSLAQAVSLDPNDPKLQQANADAKTAAAMQADSYVKEFSLKMDVLSEVASEAATNAGNVSVETLSTALKPKGLTSAQISGFLSTVTDQLGQIDPKLKLTLIPEVQQDNGLGPAPPPALPIWEQYKMTKNQWYALSAEQRRMVTSQMDGSVLKFFAGGGEDHVAQIARVGDYRMWAEPETGGEAYIPLGADKRNRSSAILRDVARQFGMSVGPAMPPGAGLAGMSAQTAASPAVVVHTSQPVSQQTTYAFNGPIQGYDLEQVKRDADRKRRTAALVGRRRS